jgi:hypothetical protein
MAKKRKKQKEEDESYEFTKPKFDEEEYLRKEVRESKTLFVTFLYAAGIGIISWGLTFFEPALAAFVGLIMVFFIAQIYRIVGIDTTKLEKKAWGSNIVIYFFTWLLIWIILSNPPFSDFQEPVIRSDGIYFGNDGNWTRINDTNREELDFTMNVSINVTVRDNVEVDETSVRITIKHGETEIADAAMESIGNDSYGYAIGNLSQNNHYYTITAKDVNGHESSYKGSFKVY